MTGPLAPSLAAAFLGCLAFAAWLLWLRRSDVHHRHVAEMEALRAYVRGEVEKLGPAILALDKRVDALAAGQAFKQTFGGDG